MARIEYRIQHLVDGRWLTVHIDSKKEIVLADWNNHHKHCLGKKRMLEVEVHEKVLKHKLK